MRYGIVATCGSGRSDDPHLAGTDVLIFLVSYFALFRALGGDYDAAVTTAGFLGMGLGTASNAMVSMQAVSNKYGVSKSAYFAVPVAGIFMDFCNAALIAVNINLWS